MFKTTQDCPLFSSLKKQNIVVFLQDTVSNFLHISNLNVLQMFMETEAECHETSQF